MARAARGNGVWDPRMAAYVAGSARKETSGRISALTWHSSYMLGGESFVT